MAAMVSDKPMGGWPPHHCWSSIAQLCEATEMNAKTVGAALDRLEAAGLIVRVGSHGATKQIKVYRLAVNEGHGTFARKATENGNLTESGNVTESGSLPDLLPKTPEFGPRTPPIPVDVEKGFREGIQRRDSPSALRPQGDAGALVTLATYTDRLKAAGEKFIPAGDPLFGYADRVGLDADMLPVALHHFRSTYLADRAAKKYADWRATFRSSVRSNWFRLWVVDQAGAVKWTSTGLQALADYRAVTAEAETAAAAGRRRRMTMARLLAVRCKTRLIRRAHDRREVQHASA